MRCPDCGCGRKKHTEVRVIAGEITPICKHHGRCYSASEIFCEAVVEKLNPVIAARGRYARLMREEHRGHIDREW